MVVFAFTRYLFQRAPLETFGGGQRMFKIKLEPANDLAPKLPIIEAACKQAVELTKKALDVLKASSTDPEEALRRKEWLGNTGIDLVKKGLEQIYAVLSDD